MAILPGRDTRPLRTALLVLLSLLPAAAAGAVDLVGTWHVLVHYTDANTSKPEQERWFDRVWVFERKGSRLEWTEFPIAVFTDESGRFERRSNGQYARVLGAWEPNEAQLQNIREGLRVNTRGSRKKSLRGSDAQGWKTVTRPQVASASVITYQETWSISGLPDHPAFEELDQMGSLRADSMEGVTRYTTTQVDPSGDVLSGSFDRDGTRRGTFRMMRSGGVGALEEKTQHEIQAEGFRRAVASSQEARRIAREELDRALAAEGVKLDQDQMDELVERAIKLITSGDDADQVGEELRRLVKERASGSLPPAPSP